MDRRRYLENLEDLAERQRASDLLKQGPVEQLDAHRVLMEQARRREEFYRRESLHWHYWAYFWAFLFVVTSALCFWNLLR